MKKLTLPSLIAFITGSNMHMKVMKTFFLTFLLGCISYSGFAQVSVTAASGGTNICSLTAATSPTTLGTITIAETAHGDFAVGANQLILMPPTGWVFITTAPHPTITAGGDVTFDGGTSSFTANALTLNFTTSGTADLDQVTISGLRIEATSSTSPSGYIYASTASGISGIETGSSGESNTFPPPSTSFGTLSIQQAAIPSVTIAAGPGSTVCAGTNVTFTPTPTNGGAPSYEWYWNGSPVSAGATYQNSALQNNDQVYAVMTATGCVSPTTATSNTITMTVNIPPSISSNPTNSIICNGNNTSFSTTATGAGLTYQWQVNTGSGFTNITNGGVYSNATTSTLNITGATSTMNGYQYQCVVSGTCAPGATTTSATLTVNTPPSISSNPTNSAICNGNNTSFSTTATGTGLTYQWQANTGSGFTNITNGGVYSNATTSTLNITGATTAMNGYEYECVVSGTCAPSATTNSATLTFNTPPSISSNPSNSIICNGDNTSFSTTATGTGLTYQWQVNTGSGFTNVTNGGVYSNATTSTLNITGATSTMNGYQYQCVVSGTCAPGATTTSATLTVNIPPSISSNPTNSIICSGNNTSFSTTATGTGLTYQWQVNTGSGFTNITNGGVYSNATTSTLNITGAITAMNGYQYQCVVSGTCAPGATTTSATLTVNTPPSISSNPTNSAICNGDNTSFSTTATGTGLTYQWQVNTGSGFTNIINGGVYSNATTSTLNITGAINTMNGYQYQCVVSGTCAPGATTTSATLTFNTPPSISSNPTNSAICNGNNTSFSTTATGTGLTYQWQVNTGSGFTNVTNGGVYSNATTSTLNITGATTAMNTYQYQCVVSGTCAPGATTTSATLTVNTPPSISSNPTNSAICNGDNTSFSTTATGAGLTYQWQVNTGSGFTNITNGGVYSNATTSTLNITGATSTMNGYQYQCVVSGTCAPGATTTSATLTVNIPPSISSNPTNSIICSGNNTSFSTTATGTGLTYQWQVNTGSGFTNITNGGVYSNATTSTLNITGAIIAMNGYQYQCVVSGTCAPGAITTSALLTVPTPTISGIIATPNPICTGNTLTLTATYSDVSGSGSYTYAWNGPGFSSGGPTTYVTNITTTDAGVYSVTVTDNVYHCQASATTSYVMVNSSPTITASVTPNPVCNGSEILLTSAPVPVGSGSSSFNIYAWSGPNGFTATTQNTSISAITPAGEGVYSVTVTDGNGCEAFNITASVTVNPLPTLTVFSNSPICAANTLTLTATAAGGSGSDTYSYSWSGPNFFTANTQNTSVANVSTADAGVYSVTATDNVTGCKSSAPGTIPVIVNSNPAITASVTPTSLCAGSTLTLASTANGGSSVYSLYTWNGPGGFTSTSGLSGNTTNPDITTAGAGVYSVTVTDSHGCMGSGTTGIVTVYSNPTITATVTPDPICAGSTLNLESTPHGGSSGYYPTFIWYGPDGYNQGGQDAAISGITTGGAGTYSVTVTDGNGCMGSITTALVMVNTDPTITATALPASLCAGATLDLSSVPHAGSSGLFTYAWSGPGGYTSTIQAPDITGIATGGTGVYSVTVTDGNGCMGSGTTSFVTVNSNPTITATVTPNPICVGNTLMLNSTPVAGSGTITTYAWTGPNLYTATTQNASRANIATTGAGVYSVMVTDNNGCIGTTTTASVTVNTNPTITTISASPTPICSANTLTLTVAPAGNSPFSYSWTGPGGYSSTAGPITANTNITTGGAGVYSVTVTDNNNCSVSAITAPVTVNPSPTITASVTPNPICTGNTLALASSPVGGSGSNLYTWSGPGGYSSTVGPIAANTNITTSGAGVYSITVTDINHCSASATTASVTVNPSPVISALAAVNPICAGNTLTLTATPSGGSNTYSGFAWNGPDGFAVLTQNTTIGSVAASNTGIYSVTVTDANSCIGTATTSVVVNPLPAMQSVTGGGSYCSGGAGVPIGLNSSQTGINYQLYDGSTPTGAAVAGTNATISFGSFTTAGGPYTAVATNTVTGCSNNMTGSVTVTILPLPAVQNVTGGGSYCANGSGVHVGLSGSVTGYNYQLYNGATPVGSPVQGTTGDTIDFGPQTTAATYTVLATNATSGCQQEMNGSAVVTTIPLPAVETVIGGGTLCAGGAGYFIGINSSAIPGLDIEYYLYNGSSVVDSAAGTGGAINFGMYATAGTYSVLATSTITGCMSTMSLTATITVNPLPLPFYITGGGSFCAGDTGVHVGLMGSQSGDIYQLYRGSVLVDTKTSTTGGVIDFGLQTVAGTYTVLATNATCSAAMYDSTVVVKNPLPNIYNVTGGGNYCVGGTGVNISLSGSDTGVDYQPYIGGTAIGSPVTDAGVSGAFNIGPETTVGTYSVLATNALTGCMSTMSLTVMVDTTSLPVVWTVTPLNGAYCSGSTGVPVGLNGSSGATVTYQLYLGTAPVGSPVTGTGSAISFGPETAGTYTVLATGPAPLGCTRAMSGDAVITENPLPDAITGAAAVCTGLTVTYSDDSTGGTWSSSSPGTATVDLTGDVTGISAGNSAITYTLPTTCYVTQTITVNQTPGAITGVTHVCAGSVSTLSDALAGGTWSNMAASTLTVNSATGAVTGVSPGIDTITYSMPTGCMAKTPDTVNAVPVVAAISATTTNVCVNGAITYTDATGSGVWSSSNTHISLVSNTGVVSGVLQGTDTIAYTVTNAAGCSSYKALGVTVDSLPVVANITGANNVCAHSTITLSDTTPGGAWSSNNILDASINSSSGIVTGVDSGSAIISYTVRNTFGCAASSLPFPLSVGDTMPLSVVEPLDSATICHNHAVVLSVVSVGTPRSYQWLDGGVALPSADSAVYTTATPGYYQVTIGNGSCFETLTGTKVVLMPAPVISYDSVANTVYTGSFTTYQWFYNDSVIAGDTTGLISYKGPGIYMVVVTNANGCSDTASDTLHSTTGIPIRQVAKDISIYPNPATSMLYIDAPGKVFVSIMSTDGRTLISRREALSVNVSQLADGVYMILIYDENNILLKTDRFVKMQ